MSIFVLSDLHLSSDGTKSMEVFGPRWKEYMQKIRSNWCAVVTDADTVIVPGDISWALKLEDAAADLAFLNNLPGQKLIGKGNHDFWWSTASKMTAFFKENGWDSIRILYNNAYRIEDAIVCGTRGWFMEEEQQNTVSETDFEKIRNREVIRLRISLEEAKKLQNDSELPIIVFLHFPPVFGTYACREILDVLHEYGITECYFGHIHGLYSVPRVTKYEGIRFTFCASDYIDFAPIPVSVPKMAPFSEK